MPETKEKKLTRKQEYFCNLIVNDPKITQEEAAIKAGYRKGTARFIAAENLTKPNIIAKIDQIKEEKKKTLDIDENWVLQKLKNFAEAEILDYFEIDPETNLLKLKDLRKLPKEKISAIESIKDTAKGIEIKLVDKRACVVDIGKHFGMFKEVLEGNINQTTTQKIFVVPAFDFTHVSNN